MEAEEYFKDLFGLKEVAEPKEQLYTYYDMVNFGKQFSSQKNKELLSELEHYKTCANVAENLLTISKQTNEKLIEGIKPLANLDLTGVTGEIVYQRNRSEITVSDVLKAKELSSNNDKQ